jgi:hypothetical protein
LAIAEGGSGERPALSFSEEEASVTVSGRSRELIFPPEAEERVWVDRAFDDYFSRHASDLERLGEALYFLASLDAPVEKIGAPFERAMNLLLGVRDPLARPVADVSRDLLVPRETPDFRSRLQGDLSERISEEGRITGAARAFMRGILLSGADPKVVNDVAEWMSQQSVVEMETDPAVLRKLLFISIGSRNRRAILGRVVSRVVMTNHISNSDAASVLERGILFSFAVHDPSIVEELGRLDGDRVARLLAHSDFASFQLADLMLYPDVDPKALNRAVDILERVPGQPTVTKKMMGDLSHAVTRLVRADIMTPERGYSLLQAIEGTHVGKEVRADLLTNRSLIRDHQAFLKRREAQPPSRATGPLRGVVEAAKAHGRPSSPKPALPEPLRRALEGRNGRLRRK